VLWFDNNKVTIMLFRLKVINVIIIYNSTILYILCNYNIILQELVRDIGLQYVVHGVMRKRVCNATYVRRVLVIVHLL